MACWEAWRKEVGNGSIECLTVESCGGQVSPRKVGQGSCYAGICLACAEKGSGPSEPLRSRTLIRFSMGKPTTSSPRPRVVGPGTASLKVPGQPRDCRRACPLAEAPIAPPEMDGCQGRRTACQTAPFRSGGPTSLCRTAAGRRAMRLRPDWGVPMTWVTATA